MGLIKAISGAINGTIADQWKEYFYCDSLDEDVLVAKGVKRISKRSSNKHGEDNIISDGSAIAVSEGQCVLIVENGKILDVSAEPGVYTFDSTTSPSIFGGTFREGLSGIIRESWDRFQFGGSPGKDQRVYYVNTKEIIGNKYGTPNPVPFRVLQENIHLDTTVSIRCNGEFSYRIINPMLFYTNVCGNVASVYTRDKIDSMLKTELLTALQPAFAKISEQGIRYAYLPGHTLEIADALNEVLTKKWIQLRGIQVWSFGINSVTASKEDEDRIKKLEQAAALSHADVAAGIMTEATANAMEAAANNAAGAMTGFMGLNMASQAGNINTADLYARAAAEKEQAAAAKANTWKCACGTENTGNFCSNCGTAKPVANEWTCSCGTVNTGNFCSNCGTAKPASNEWTCSCGTVNTGNFCSNCGKSK